MPRPPTIQASVDALQRCGCRFKPVAAPELARLGKQLGAPFAKHPWLDLLGTQGVLEGSRDYAMLGPKQVLAQRDYQRSFYEGGSFGDTLEDKANLECEQSLRSSPEA